MNPPPPAAAMIPNGPWGFSTVHAWPPVLGRPGLPVSVR